MTSNLPAAADQPLSVTQVGRLDLAQDRVSSHLSRRRWCGCVAARAVGTSNKIRAVSSLA